MNPFYQDDAVTILNGDCREMMKTLADCSVDSVLTDPPYELGFMGKHWDRSGIAYDVNVWRECLRVLKPGGHLLAFGGSRTYHRLACAIEDAGFGIRDQIMWLYGQGFPKSKDVAKALDEHLGAERPVLGLIRGAASSNTESLGVFNSQYVQTTAATWAAKQWDGWGTALKPAHEPIVLARKPLIGTVAENVLQHGTGGLNIDECRIETDEQWSVDVGSDFAGDGGWREGQRRSHVAGRWPANVIHDGSEEVLAGFPDTEPSKANMRGTMGESPFSVIDGSGRSANSNSVRGHNDNGGSAARFFYTAKASKQDREDGLSDLPLRSAGEVTDRQDGSDGLNSPRAGAGRTSGSRNNHPTVKPLALMRYLVRLVTPPGGVTLDPFCGSGSTGKACVLEGFKAILIDVDAGYCELAAKRCQIDYQPGLFTVTEPTPFNQPEIDDTPTQSGLFAVGGGGD